MSRILTDLEELTSNGVINQETAGRIREYYARPKAGPGRMLIAFGIVGALLVGMGIVMILAHNWDNFTNSIKLAFGLAPLLITQLICGILIWRGSTSSAWREASAVLLVFAIATAISIVAQVYNIPGELDSFLLTWTFLCLPIPYIMQSRIASLLCWIGITWYAVDTGFGFSQTKAPVYYWLLAAALLPYYIHLLRKAPHSNGISLHTWFIAISFASVLGLTNFDADDLIVPAYITMFSGFILLGQLPQFAGKKLMSNGWLVVGSGSMIIMLLFLTFEWPDLDGHDMTWWLGPELFTWIALFAGTTYLLYVNGRRLGYANLLSKSYTYLAFIPLLIVGLYSPGLSRVFTNVLLLVLGAYTIREGALSERLWQMNYGLLILSVLIICRFFDTEMSFVIRGLLFVAIGLGFFGMNYYVMKKRKAEVAP